MASSISNGVPNGVANGETHNSKTSDFLKTLDQLGDETFSNIADRQLAIQAARSLVTRLERPWDTMLYLCWTIVSVVSKQLGES